MIVRINDYIEFKKDNKLVCGNVSRIKEDSFDAKCIINDKIVEIKDLKEKDMDKIMTKTVLIYIEKNDSYLMLLKNNKGNMNHGKWLGIGGHIEISETSEEALIREVKEETNLDLLNYENSGTVYFHDNNYLEIMNLYKSNSFKDELGSCDEGTLKWVKKDEILNLNLWEGDKSFLPLLIENKPYFEIELIYNNGKLVKVNKM